MRKKIFIYTFISSIIAVIITGAISFAIIQSSAINETKLSAEAMARIIMSQVDNEDSDLDVFTKELGTSLSYDKYNAYRITIVGYDGIVLGDSIADINKMDNHIDRPEIIQAKLTGLGSSRRDSSTLKTDMLYVAVRDENNNIFVRVALHLTQLQRMVRKLILGCLLGILSGAVIALISAYIFADRLSKPIKSLAHASAEFAGGNMDMRVDMHSNTEIDSLAMAFNNMADNLENLLYDLKLKNTEFNAVLSSMEEGLIAVDVNNNILYINPVAKEIFFIKKDNYNTKKLSSFVYQDVIIDGINACLADCKTQNIQLKLGNEDRYDYRVSIYPMYYNNELSGAILLFANITHTLKLERLRSDFVANVSHELRTPLTSIKGYAETLKDEGLEGNKNADKFLGIIEIEADRLNALINDLMDLSEIENKKEDVNISVHELDDIVNDVIDIVSISAEKKDIDIELNIEKKITVLVNKDRLKQLLLNLIDNAIKYNKVGGKVIISASSNYNVLNLIVKDTGDGIEKEKIPRLFERFYRVDKSRSKLSGGTGLGLSIVKHITELYNGSVSLVSEMNVGSEFIVEVPIIVNREN